MTHGDSSLCSTQPTHLNQMNPGNALPSDFCDIHFNTVFPSMPESLKWSPSVTVPHQTLHTHLFSQFIPYIPISLDLITLMYGKNVASTHFSADPVTYEIYLVI